MSIVSLIGDFGYVAFTTVGAAAIGGFGTPMVCSKFKKQPTEGLEAIPQFLLGGLAGGALGLTFGIVSVKEDNAKDAPATQIIEFNQDELPACEGNHYFVDKEGQIIGCAFD